MTKTKLKGLLAQLFNSHQQVSIPSDFSNIPSFQEVFKEHFGNDQLVVSEIVKDLSNLQINGKTNYWNVEVDIDLQFYVDRGDVNYKIELSFADDWNIKESFPDFIENTSVPFFNESKLLFISSAKVPDLEILDNFERDPHLYFLTQQSISGALTPVKWLLGEAPTLQLAGPVTIENDLPDMELVTHIEETVKFDFFNQLPVAFVWNSQVVPVPNDPSRFYNQVYFEIQTFIPFQGKDIILKANFINDLGALNFIAELEDISINDLSGLNSLCNDTDIGAMLPDELGLGNQIGLKQINMSLLPKKKNISSIGFTLNSLNSWELIDGFSANDLELDVIITQPGKKTLRSTAISISGNMAFGNTTELDFNAIYPEKIISAQLVESSHIPISEVASKIFPIGELPNLSISELDLSFAPSDRSISVLTQIESGWGINFGNNSIQLQNVNLELHKDGDDKSAYITASANLLGLHFLLSGTYEGPDSGWTFQGVSTPGDELSVSSLVESVIDFFGVNVPLYNPDIKLSSVEILLNTKTKRFYLSAASSVKTAMHIAGKRILVDSSISLQSSLNQQTKKRSLVGNIYASVELVEGFRFDLQFTMNDAQPVTYGSWTMVDDKSLSLDDLLQALKIDSLSFPDPATKALVDTLRTNVLDNLALTGISFTFHGPRKELTLKADTKLFGTLVMTSHKPKASTKWQQILGLEFPSDFKLSDIPGLKDVLSATDFMAFQNVAVLLTTSDQNGTKMPDMSSPNQGSSGETFLESTNLYLSKGVNVAAKIDLDPENNDNASVTNLQAATGLDSLTIQAALGKDELNFRSSLDGEIGFSVGDDQLDFQDPYVQLDVLPKFGLQLGGSLMVDFMDTKIKAEGGIVITPMEASGRLMVSAHDPDATDTSHANATGNLLEPLGINGIQLNSIGFIVGATFFPPGVKFGMQAGFAIGEQDSSSNKLATVLQVIPAVPSPVVNLQLLSFQLAEMDVNTILTVFTNGHNPELPEFVGAIRATDIGFSYCSTITTLPDGNTALPGFGFHGNVNLFGFKTRAMLEVNPMSGIRGEFQMSPINIEIGGIPILSVTGKGEEISNYFVEDHRGKWVKVSNEDGMLPTLPDELDEDGNSPPVPAMREEVIMDGGGAVFKFDSNGPRYLFASVEVSLFDFITTTIEAEISQTGMAFLYQYRVSDILEIDFDMEVDWAGSNPGFTGKASFDLDLDFEVPLPLGLPSIDLDAGLHASCLLKINGDEFLFRINGSFEFEGIEFTLLDGIELKIPFGSLKDIAQKIFDYIISNAEEIFAEIFAFLREAWEAFEEGVTILYEETKKLVENIAEEAGEIATAAIDFAEKAVDAAVQEVAEVVEDIEKEIGKAYETGKKFVEDTAEAIVEIGKVAAEAFDDFVEDAAAVLEAAGEVAKEVFNEAKQFVENVGREIAAIAEDAVEAVKKFAADAVKEAKKILDAAVKVAKQIWEGIKNTVATLLKAAKALENLAKAVWKEIDEFLAAAAKAIEDAAEDVVDWVSDAGSAIGNTLDEAC